MAARRIGAMCRRIVTSRFRPWGMSRGILRSAMPAREWARWLACTMAVSARDGFARALRPVHTPFDGDLVFAVSAAKCPIGAMRHQDVMRLGSIAADCLARAIARGVFEAESIGELKGYRDTFRP